MFTGTYKPSTVSTHYMCELIRGLTYPVLLVYITCVNSFAFKNNPVPQMVL